MASEVVGEAFVRIKALVDKAGFERDVTSSTVTPLANAGKAAGQKFSQGLASGLAGLASGAAFVKLAGFAKSTVKAAEESEVAYARLGAAFKAMPALADTNIEAFTRLNLALQKKVAFDDEAFASGEALLASFKLTGAQITQLMPLVADLAARTGNDIPTASRLVGMALLGNTRGLKQVGIEFKRTGDTTRDFNSILGLLQGKVGGVAEALGKTAAGQAKIASNQFMELKETLGKSLLPVMLDVAKAGAFVAEKLAAAPGPVLIGAEGLAGLALAAVAISKVVAAVQVFTALIPSRVAAAAADAAAQTGLATATTVANVAIAEQVALFPAEEFGLGATAAAARLAGTQMGLFAEAEGAATAAGAGVAASSGTAAAGLGASRLATLGLAAGFGVALVGAYALSKALESKFNKPIDLSPKLSTDELVANFQKVLSATDIFGKSLADKAFKGLAEQSEGTARRLLSGLAAAGGLTADQVAHLGKVLDGVSAANKRAAADAGAAGNAIGGMGGAAAAAVTDAERLAEAMDKLSLAGATVGDQATAMSEAIGATLGGTVSLSSASDTADAAVSALADSFKADSKAAEDAAQKHQAVTDALVSLADAQAKYNEVAAQDQTENIQRKEIAAQEAAFGLVDAQRALIDAQQKLNDLRSGKTAEILSAEQDLTKAQAQSAQGTVGKTQMVLDAEKALADARAKAAADQVVAAEDVAKAQLAVQTATLDAQDAQAEADRAKAGIDHAKELADAQRGVEDAQKKVNQAQKDAAAPMQTVNDKLAEQRAKGRDAATSMMALADQMVKIGQLRPDQEIAFVNTKLREMEETVPGAKGQLDGFVGTLDALDAQLGGPHELIISNVKALAVLAQTQQVVDTLKAGLANLPLGWGGPIAKALGLPGAAGGGMILGPTWVGERGPEIFTPPNPGWGWITPHDQSTALASQASAGEARPTLSVVQHNYTVDPMRAARENVLALREAQYLGTVG